MIDVPYQSRDPRYIAPISAQANCVGAAMRRIGLTQRIEVHPATKERRESLDQAWSALLWSLDLMPVPLCSGISLPSGEYLIDLELDGVILTGGNDLGEIEGAQTAAPDRDEFEFALIRECGKRRLPMLGVCRGMQVINVFFGGHLREVSGHVGTHHAAICTPYSRDAFPEALQVNSFHNYGIAAEDLARPLRATAVAEDATIEALRHESWEACQAVMWHPERNGESTSADRSIIARLFHKDS